MGMYTQIYVKATFKENLSDNVVNIIKYMLKMDDIKLEDLDLPNHPLFKTDRWEWMLQSSSFYHIPFAVNRFEYNEISKNYYLIAVADFKNYDGEIGKFFDWIKQYLYKGWDKQFIGYSLYEEAIEPILYYLEGEVE